MYSKCESFSQSKPCDSFSSNSPNSQFFNKDRINKWIYILPEKLGYIK